MRALFALVLVACAGKPPPPPETDDLDPKDRMVERAELANAPAPPDAAVDPQIHVAVVDEDGGVPSATGPRIDLDVRDADIPGVLRMIAAAAKINLVVPDDVKGKVTLDIRHVTWRQAIDVIAQLEGLVVDDEDGIITVKPGP